MAVWQDRGYEEPGKEYWYRFEGVQYAPPLNEFDEPVGEGNIGLVCTPYLVIKHTQKGVWIHYSGNPSDKKFILKEANKRFACPTKAEALESLLFRKKKQKRIYEARAKSLDRMIRVIKTELEGMVNN